MLCLVSSLMRSWAGRSVLGGGGGGAGKNKEAGKEGNVQQDLAFSACSGSAWGEPGAPFSSQQAEAAFQTLSLTMSLLCLKSFKVCLSPTESSSDVCLQGPS